MRASAVLAVGLAGGLIVTGAVPWSDADDTTQAGAQETTCNVRVPKLSRPPGEGGKQPGNGHLWGWIPHNGRLVARPRGEPGLPKANKDGSITTKVLWLGRLSSRTRKRRLTVTGTRLDADAKGFRIGPRRGGWNGEALYWPGYVTFSTPGCWKIAATAGTGTRLMAVISVELPQEETEPQPAR